MDAEPSEEDAKKSGSNVAFISFFPLYFCVIGLVYTQKSVDLVFLICILGFLDEPVAQTIEQSPRKLKNSNVSVELYSLCYNLKSSKI